MIPFVIPVRNKLFGHYDGFAFFIFIFYWRNLGNKTITLHHERIHFYQQLECLFVLHWMLYAAFYLWGRLTGKTHDRAYYDNPFEREAYAYEKDFTYLHHRPFFNWIKFLRPRV